MTNRLTESLQVAAEQHGLRLDQFLAKALTDFSRSQSKQWIQQGDVCVNAQVITAARHKVSEGDKVVINTELAAQGEWQAQPIPLDIIFEDEHILVINKPVGLVVHPGAGVPDGTLVNALLHHDSVLKQLPRAGLVHRLDKDTSGLLVVAKTHKAHTHLVQTLQARKIERRYQAVVNGSIIAGGTIEAAIGRDPRSRTKMSVHPLGKEAVTHYRVLERFPHFTLLDVKLETGRTHQIRVHMAHIHHAIIGDTTYNRRIISASGLSEHLRQTLRSFKRQALHAYQLSLHHPETNEWLSWQAALPGDMTQLLATIREEDHESH